VIDMVAFKALVTEAVREVVREELDRALGARRSLSKAELAAALGKSTATIDRHVRGGMPFAQEGARRTFDLDACRSWLRNPPSAPSTAGAPTKEQDDVLSQGVVKKSRTRKAA